MNIELSKVGDSGAYSMKPSQLTGEAKWRDIEDLINRWARRNPRGARELEAAIKETRSTLADKKYGKSGAEAMGRLGLCIHPELLNYIEAFYPKFMQTKDEMHEFMRRFPKFTIPERI